MTGNTVAFLDPVDALLLNKGDCAYNGLPRGGGGGQRYHRDTECAENEESGHDLNLMENSLGQFINNVNAAFG